MITCGCLIINPCKHPVVQENENSTIKACAQLLTKGREGFDLGLQFANSATMPCRYQESKEFNNAVDFLTQTQP